MGSSWSHLGGGVGWRSAASPAWLQAMAGGGGELGFQSTSVSSPGAVAGSALRHVLSLMARRGRERRRWPCARCHLPLPTTPPPRGHGPARWRVWTLSGRRGGARGVGPCPKRQGSGGATGCYCWGHWWPLVASSSAFHGQLQPPPFGRRFDSEGPTLVAISHGGSSRWAPTQAAPVRPLAVERWSRCPLGPQQRGRGALGHVVVEVWATCSWSTCP